MPAQGSTAPDFSLPDQNGDMHTLRDYRGKWVILYFYPKDLTPGCTIEACNFRDDFTQFKNLDAIIFGISKDSIERHKKFAHKYELPFILLSDEDAKVCDEYEVWKTKSMYGRSFLGIERSTYLIDPQGKIAKEYHKVKVKDHSKELLNDLKNF
jgi:peroxiredoxin Q/BCP